jgi:hypothetical protein
LHPETHVRNSREAECLRTNHMCASPQRRS